MMPPLAAARGFLPRSLSWIDLAAGGALALVLALALVKAPSLYRGAVGVLYLALLVLIAVHDVRTLRAPNRIVYPALGVAILASFTLGWEDAREALLGGLVAFVVLLVIALAGRGKMGFGDVKAGCLCGIVVGLHGVLPMLMIAFLAGAAVAAPLLLLGVRKRSDVVPFTPFFAGATLFSLAYYPLYLWS